MASRVYHRASSRGALSKGSRSVAEDDVGGRAIGGANDASRAATNQEEQDACASSNSVAQDSAVAAATAAPPRPHPHPPLHVAAHRPSTSPMVHAHTSHAMILQMQEYRERVQNACQSTYQFPLQQPRKPPVDADGKPRAPKSKGYCRSHVLATNKQFFHAREPTPSHFSIPVDVKDRVLPRKGGDVYINFHQMKPRKDEFLFGEQGNTRPKIAHDGNSAVGIAKDHFALGPGQYDVANLRPKTSTAVKFSPSDRFHENFSTDQLGPGQYITSEALTVPRPAVAVFSQTPRRTEAALLVSPTANIVSSYYYVPESSFVDKNAPQNDNPSWPRSSRLSSRKRTTKTVDVQCATDFVVKNKTRVDTQSAVQRLRKARKQQGRLGDRKSNGRASGRRHTGGDDSDSEGVSLSQKELMAPPTVFKRRSSIFLDIGTSLSQGTHDHQNELSTATSTANTPARKPSNTGSSSAITATPAISAAFAKLIQENAKLDKSLRGWVTLANIASFSVRMGKIFHVIRVIRAIELAEREHLARVVFNEWKKLDRARSLQFSTQLIARNTFKWRLHVRIRRKCAHVDILRRFLGGLSIDVQFAIAMKKIKRKIQLIQRWWRHVQLMVKAREEALYYKWVSVETRLRLEYINQMPHLQRIFQQPPSSGSATASSSAGGGSATGNASHQHSDLTLQKLLNLPEQKKWFTARFVLTSDGCLRGYCNDASAAASGADSKDNLVVEVKNYRCNFHEGVASSADDTSDGESLSLFDSGSNSGSATELSSMQAYHNYSNARWKPFMMVFRQGAFRFVLLTSASPMPTEILSWKDKLERLVMTPASNSSGGGFGSIAGLSGGSNSSSALALSSSESASSSSHHHVLHHGNSGFHTSVSEFVEVSMQSGILASHGHHHLTPMQSFTTASGSSISLSSASSVQLAATLARSPSIMQPRGKLQTRVRSIRQRNRMGMAVSEGELTYYVVDLLKDFPKVPAAIVWQTIRDKLREKRKSFRAEIYRYNLEMYHFHRHQEQTKHIHVLDKFKEFFTLERPRRPHFRSLISNRKMEAIIRQTIDQLKTTMPSDPKYLLDASKPLS